MRDYTFTADWFGSHDIEKILPVGTTNELHILEIGSYEGKSSVWFVENLLNNPLSTLTCIDPWQDYVQNEDSINLYQKEHELSFHVGSNRIFETFEKNILETGKKDQVFSIRDYSHDALSFLKVETSKKYDIIFIDGNHTAPFVLTDAVLSWYLLKTGGLMIFDDYMWEADKKETIRPQLSIDCFLRIFSDYIEVIWKESRVIIKKK